MADNADRTDHDASGLLSSHSQEGPKLYNEAKAASHLWDERNLNRSRIELRCLRITKCHSKQGLIMEGSSVALVAGIGNCQVEAMARCAAKALELEPTYLRQANTTEYADVLRKTVAEASVIFATRGAVHQQVIAAAKSVGRMDLAIIASPRFHFAGFHPDMTAPSMTRGRFAELPMGGSQSAILLAAWREGLSEVEAMSLFRGDVYDALGYFDVFELSKEALIEECAHTGIDVRPLIPLWLEKGAFVYMPSHPRIDVLGDMTALLLKTAGVYSGGATQEQTIDNLAGQAVWPIYPEIAQEIGLVGGDYVFRRRAGAEMDLKGFVERTYSCWRAAPPQYSEFERMKDRRLENISRFIAMSSVTASANPYRNLGPTHWWSKAVAEPEVHDVDPATVVKFKIKRTDKVATAGSCFAQHISKRLSTLGFNFLVTEQAPADCRDPLASDYGVLTARFGNIYTVRQLMQLADYAYGNCRPAIDAWPVPGGYLDPFRPRIGGSPFASLQELRAAREVHFAAVREMFETCDVFVFTLGLTEGWRAKVDDAVVPLPPGVVGAESLAHEYIPHNFSVADVIKDLEGLIELFSRLNSRVQIILTVSPVPLIATHQIQHVLEATTYSKSALRAAAGEIAHAHPHVAYFPSYEIITGAFNRGRYFAEDLRSVTSEGVDHVMRVFLRHYAGIGPLNTSPKSNSDQFRTEAKAAMNIICDEEEIGLT